MHEASIAQHIIDQMIEKVSDGSIPASIQTIHLKIGKLTSVVPDNLAFMFEVLSKDTSLEGVKLDIIEIDVRCLCKNCKAEYEAEEMNFWCRECGSPEVAIITGRELLIDSVEVNDVDETH